MSDPQEHSARNLARALANLNARVQSARFVHARASRLTNEVRAEANQAIDLWVKVTLLFARGLELGAERSPYNDVLKVLSLSGDSLDALLETLECCTLELVDVVKARMRESPDIQSLLKDDCFDYKVSTFWRGDRRAITLIAVDRAVAAP